jgi:DnaD/phage-associated family protein
MGTVQLSNNTSTTTISNIFIDSIMPTANGEFVKVYLYLLKASQTSSEFTVSATADKFSMTEGDIIRALNFWQDKKMLTLTFSSTKELSSIIIIDPKIETEPKLPLVDTTIKIDSLNLTPKTFVKTKYSLNQLESLASTDEIRELLYMVEMGIGKPLSPKDMEEIVFIYDGLKLPFDVIEYLIEYCVSNNHRKLSYISTTALNWAEDGVDTVEKAKHNASIFNKNYFAVMKAFGIINRNPSDYELTFLKKWFKQYNFEIDIVLEACTRTIKLTHQPSFDYSDSILTAWYNKSVKTLSDINILDQDYNKNKTTTLESNSIKGKAKSTNKFNNFQQREYDYDALEKKLAQKQMQIN